MPDSSSENTKRQIAQSTVLSQLTAGVVVALLIIFFLTTIGNTTTILSKVESVKEDQYPVSVAAGHLETRFVQLRTIASQATFVNSAAGADELMRVTNQIDDEMASYIETIANSASVKSDDVRSLEEGYARLNDRMDELAEMLRDTQVPNTDVNWYVDEEVYPLISMLLEVDRSVLDKSTRTVDNVYEAVNEACRQTILLAWILVIAVMVMVFIYLAILHRKTKREETLTADLEHSIDAARTANNAKSTFLSSMSHDIRTPMNAIVGLTTIAKANLDDPEKVESCLERITISSKHLLSLVNDVLDMSEIEAGRITLAEDVVNLRELIDDLTVVMQIQARSRQLSFEVDAEGLEHEMVRGDAMRIQQVMMNLTSNAIKYTQPGGWVRVDVSEAPTSEPGVFRYRLVVEDNGIGMEEDFLESIFKPFERERNETTHTTEGAGLGMTITKSVVDLMGGTIEVQSEAGRGSKFTVETPLEAVEDAPLRDGAANAEDEKLLSGRVLLVEDDELNREIAIELIAALGPEVETAVDGVDALEKFQAAPEGWFDLIFMDFQMPRMGGVETATKLVAWEQEQGRAHTPIVAMTANAFNEDRQHAAAAGMDGFMSKPINVGNLSKHLHEHLGPKA